MQRSSTDHIIRISVSCKQSEPIRSGYSAECSYNVHPACDLNQSCFPRTTWLTVFLKAQQMCRGDICSVRCLQYISLTSSPPPPHCVCPLTPPAKHTPSCPSCSLARKTVSGLHRGEWWLCVCVPVCPHGVFLHVLFVGGPLSIRLWWTDWRGSSASRH